MAKVFFIIVVSFSTAVLGVCREELINLAPSVVVVVGGLKESTADQTMSAATAFTIKLKGQKLLVTNAHFCNAVTSNVSVNFGLATYSSKQLYSSFTEEVDLCIIAIPDALRGRLVPLPIAKHSPKLGDLVTIHGFRRDPTHAYRNSCVIVNPRFQVKNNETTIFGDVKMGMSGSPVVNKCGKVVGVVVATYAPKARYGIFIKLEVLKKFLVSFLKQQSKGGS